MKRNRVYTRWEPVPNATAKASWYVFWSLAISVLFAFGVAQAMYTLDYRWLAVAFGATVSYIQLENRKDAHDILQSTERYVYRAEDRTPAPAPPPAQETIRPYVIHQAKQNHIKIGKYGVSQKEGARLSKALQDNDMRFTRDTVRGANVASLKDDIYNGRWADVVGEFERLGMVENGEITMQGREWLRQFTTPLPYSNGTH